jgi:hypothetical protein
MNKRKESTDEQIKLLEELYDDCHKQMDELSKALTNLQNVWTGTWEQLQVLYKLKGEVKDAKRQKVSSEGAICPVLKRKDSFPDPPKSM